MSYKSKLEGVENERPGSYSESQAVRNAQSELAAYQAEKPSDYSSAYAEQLDSILKEITSRPSFQYDLAADPLYAQYRAQYTRLGRQAAENASAGAAALTGGYANSYAATAAAQADQQYLAKLNDMVPELYDRALKGYQAEGTALTNRLGAMQNADKTAYNRWRDSYDDWYSQLEYLTDAADTAYRRDYNEYSDRYDAWENWRDYYADEAQKEEQNEMARQKQQEAQREWEAEYAFEQQKYRDAQAAAAAEAAQKAAAVAMANSSTSGGSKSTTSAGAAKKSAASSAVPTDYANALRMAKTFFNTGRGSAEISRRLRSAGYSQKALEYALANLRR